MYARICVLMHRTAMDCRVAALLHVRSDGLMQTFTRFGTLMPVVASYHHCCWAKNDCAIAL